MSILPAADQEQPQKRPQHPFYKLAKHQNERARALGAAGRLTGYGLERLWWAQRGRCAYTRKKLIRGVNASVDHLVPLSEGGTNTLDNVVFVLVEINVRKCSYPLFAYCMVHGLPFDEIVARIWRYQAKLAKCGFIRIEATNR